MKFIVALITFSSVVSDVTGVMNEYAEGNLQVLFNATSALSGDDYPQMAKVADLWYVQKTPDKNDCWVYLEVQEDAITVGIEALLGRSEVGGQEGAVAYKEQLFWFNAQPVTSDILGAATWANRTLAGPVLVKRVLGVSGRKENVPFSLHIDGSLGCQVRSNVSKKLMPIKEAHFMRNVDMAMMPASVRNNQASLSFGWTSLHSSGKYRCQITTHQNQQILGWLFVNMRPVFHVDVASNFEIDKHDPFHVISPILRVTEGETLVIDCPILGFPQPTIEWLKDNASIDTSVQRITYEKKGIKIWNASLEAEGVYSCIGRNSFAEVDNGPIINWQSRLDITLQVKKASMWFYILIAITMLLMIMIMVVCMCFVFNRFKTYSVEKHEKRE